MSLNHFSLIDDAKPWMNINCNEVESKKVITQELDVDNLDVEELRANNVITDTLTLGSVEVFSPQIYFTNSTDTPELKMFQLLKMPLERFYVRLTGSSQVIVKGIGINGFYQMITLEMPPFLSSNFDFDSSNKSYHCAGNALLSSIGTGHNFGISGITLSNNKLLVSYLATVGLQINVDYNINLRYDIIYPIVPK